MEYYELYYKGHYRKVDLRKFIVYEDAEKNKQMVGGDYYDIYIIVNCLCKIACKMNKDNINDVAQELINKYGGTLEIAILDWFVNS
jgi:3-deoxy-D-manno-octulosonate 8-phosphate phosphatase KdsC-like HAD superfamily phosphatase